MLEYVYVYMYPNDKQCVTSVIIPIYNEIQKKGKKTKERELSNRRYMFFIVSHISSAIDRYERVFEEKEIKKKKKKNCCLS